TLSVGTRSGIYPVVTLLTSGNFARCFFTFELRQQELGLGTLLLQFVFVLKPNRLIQFFESETIVGCRRNTGLQSLKSPVHPLYQDHLIGAAGRRRGRLTSLTVGAIVMICDPTISPVGATN